MRDDTIPATELMGAHLRTYEALFRPPTTQHLKWEAVQALFRNLGRVEEEKNGALTFTRNGRSLVMPKPATKDIESPTDVAKLRDFLRLSAPPKAAAAPTL